MSPLIHHLTHPGDLTASAVVCGDAAATVATWDLAVVTCEVCNPVTPPRRTREGGMSEKALLQAVTAAPDPCQACRASVRTQRSDGSRRKLPQEPARIASEKEFQELVRQTALASGWMYYHTTDSRHSPAGFVDTVLVREGRCVVAELKMPGNKPTAAQQSWLAAWSTVPGVEVFVWIPEDLAQIMEVLR